MGGGAQLRPGGLPGPLGSPAPDPKRRRGFPGRLLTPVLLTGGTGLVGSHVARALRSRGDEVVCLQRPSSDTTHLRSLGCRIVSGDLRDDPEELARSMEGCAGLVHSAALVYPDVSWPRLRKVNVGGTRRILRAAGLAGVERAVHLSSVAVYGDPTRASLNSERRAQKPGLKKSGSGSDAHLDPGPDPSFYARSKIQAEEVAFQAMREWGTEVCALRPCGIYGERDRALTRALARLVRLPVTPVLGTGERSLPLVYAGKVAEAVLLLLEAPGVDGQVFDLGEDDPVTQSEALRALARGMGAEVRLLRLPAAPVEWAAWLWDAAARRISGPGKPSVARLVRLATRGNPFSSDELRERLGWKPRFGSVEALERTGRWIAGHATCSDMQGGIDERR